MYVEESGRIFVNLFDPAYPVLKDFLISCCEPISRTHRVNEYQITPQSLSAAEAEGSYTMGKIRDILQKYGRFKKKRRMVDEQQSGDGGDANEEDGSTELFKIPPTILDLLQQQEGSSKLKLILREKYGGGGNNTSAAKSPLAYYLCGSTRTVLQWVIEGSDAVRACLEPTVVGGVSQLIISYMDDVEVVIGGDDGNDSKNPKGNAKALEEKTTSESKVIRTRTVSKVVYCAQVKDNALRSLRKEVEQNLGISIDCFYDFKNDSVSKPVPNFTLGKQTKLRPYQEASLERFQRGKKAHHGVVVLPCGAGKTLTGISAASIIGKKTVVMCCNVQSVLQWREQFLKWTNLKPSQVTICTQNEKQIPGDIFITTYNMVTMKQKDDHAGEGDEEANVASSGKPKTKEEAEREEKRRQNAEHKKKIMDTIKQTAWGLLVLDEVHMAPAESFQKVIDRVTHHCVLGLTATLLREDNKIVDLRYLIGPKLYEANWLELTRAGHLATVACAEVRCPLPAPFLSKYLQTTKDSVWKDIECINPNKLWCVQALLKFHESRSPPDKTIIFCDCVPAAKYYAQKLGVPYMIGQVKPDERNNLLTHFRWSPNVNTVIISKVGDIALDMPEATVIIQISGLFGSRRQEAQRLGRILRPKPPHLDNSCAYFYSLISLDTDEVRHAFGRQAWLRDQGFAYRVLSAETILEHFHKAKLSHGSPSSALPPALLDTTQTSNVSTSSVPSELLCIGPSVWSHATESGWSEFSTVASGYIERAFNDGRALVEIAEIGAKVMFDTQDLPHTNGTVIFNVSGKAAQQPMTRRVRRGRGTTSTTAHHCILPNDPDFHTPCLRHLLEHIGVRSAGGVAGGGTSLMSSSAAAAAAVANNDSLPKRRTRKEKAVA